MEQPLRCKFRGPPNTVNDPDPQRQGGRADGGWNPRSRPILQAGVRTSPRGVPVGLNEQ